MLQNQFLFIRCILYLITAIPYVRSIEIRCEENVEGTYVCTNKTLPAHLTDCCYNYELNAYFCCLHYEFRNQSQINRLTGLIVVIVILIILSCLLCIFCKRCPGRWYLEKYLRRREVTNNTTSERNEA